EPPRGWELWLHEPEAVADSTDRSVQLNNVSDELTESNTASSESTAELAGLDRSALIELAGELQKEVGELREQTNRSVVEMGDDEVLLNAGIYNYRHPLDDAAEYRERLDELSGRISELARSGSAVFASDQFTLDGSLAKGRRMTQDFAILLLRAYNAEAENCVRSMRKGNSARATARLDRAVNSIEKLGALMELRINPEYHALRVVELELTADFQMKKEEERQRAREEREELRQQRRVEAELAAERERLDKERSHYAAAIAALASQGGPGEAEELRARLMEIDEAIAANDFRAANIRAGYVYVISNVGAFGPGIVKIGMTRRLEPRDRVRELGDASVPFVYDTHALFFSEDAVSLENELHKKFADRRVNHVNQRREFFFASPSEVREALTEKVGGLLEFNEEPDALEYLQSRSLWPPDL
ncbi:DUF4041 domain-containing protein, partial [Dietzia sp. NPDC055343]